MPRHMTRRGQRICLVAVHCMYECTWTDTSLVATDLRRSRRYFCLPLHLLQCRSEGSKLLETTCHRCLTGPAAVLPESRCHHHIQFPDESDTLPHEPA